MTGSTIGAAADDSADVASGDESGESGTPSDDPGESGAPSETGSAEAPEGEGQRADPEFPSELEIRWRQTRNAPPPVVRAVMANVAIAAVGGLLLLIYDWAGSDGGEMFSAVAYIVIVIVSGTVLTYLWVELPTGASGEKRRSPWAGVLGFFASVPIVYLSLVVIFQILRPLLP
jgi:hypothetical protein